MKFLTQAQFVEMWNLQDQLNSVIHPQWKEQNFNWNLCIKSEIMEFSDYIGWKHWKEPSKTQKPTDMQARLELVDIWHFLLSSIIEVANQEPAKEYLRATKRLILDRGNKNWQELSIQKLDNNHIDNTSKINFLWDALQLCEWTWDELYKAYLGKVALNNFRQANGYKEGSYEKIWRVEPAQIDGILEKIEREDNYFLEQILAQLSLTEGALTYQAVYAKLGIEYMLRCDPPVTIQD